MAERCPWWAPPLLAVQFLTRVPVPLTDGLSAEAVAAGLVRAVAWFPLVGTLVGAATAGIALAAAAVWPAAVAVVLALAAEALLTGAFHEDAVADFCDAFGGGQTAQDVRRILKDSRIGSYGAVGLVLVLALRATLLVALLAAGPALLAAALIASATWGRLLVVGLMALVPPATDGLAKDIAGDVGWRRVMLAGVLAGPGLIGLAWLSPWAIPVAAVATLAFAVWFRRLLLRRIGGATGDCLGFGAYAGQLLMLLAAAG